MSRTPDEQAEARILARAFARVDEVALGLAAGVVLGFTLLAATAWLVLKGGAWYLVARRSAGMRVYRVSRFASVRIREEGFERPEGFELAPYWDDWSRSFEDSRPRVEVKLRASELALRFLPRDLRGEDGVFVVGFESLEVAFRELLKFGPDAEVLEPIELRDRIAATAVEVASLYDVRALR